MRPTPYGRQATPSALPRILLMAGMLVCGAFGSIVLLVAGGVVDVPFLHGKASEPKHQGVPVPLSARAIPAYAQILRDHIMDAKTLELTIAYYPPDVVQKNAFLTLDQFFDHLRDHRVVAKDIPAGSAFDEKCFLPPGTKPGMVAGVPNGKVSYVLDARQVDGVSDLKIGDHIDILGAVMMEFDKTTRAYHTIPTAPNRAGDAKAQYKEGQTGIVVALAQNAVVVEPLTMREVPDEKAPIPVQTGKPKMRAAQDITIAIDPEEAGPLTEAVAVGGEIFVVAHTGLPNELPSLTTPGFMPLPQIQTVETIVGGKHEVKYFADPSGRMPTWSLPPAPHDQKPSPASPPGPTKTAEAAKDDAATDAAKNSQP